MMSNSTPTMRCAVASAVSVWWYGRPMKPMGSSTSAISMKPVHIFLRGAAGVGSFDEALII